MMEKFQGQGDVADRSPTAGKLPLIAGLVSMLLSAGLANARVSEEEAARLGADLAPFGAEVAGNEEGTIPPWSGKWKGLPPGLEYDGPAGKRPSPYADDQLLFSITPENYTQHKDHLSEGQIALFERYPTFRMDVYPTHRDFDYHDRTVEKTRWNATHTELSNGVESLANYTGGLAFPIPADAYEVMWNTRTTPCYASSTGKVDNYAVYANGERAHTAADFLVSWPFNNPDNPIPTTEEIVGDRQVYALSTSLAPPRVKGRLTAVQDPMDYVAKKRNAWMYDPGSRRVRKAPSIGYDNPYGPGGLQTSDDTKGFNGGFDRYDFTLLGKKEIYIPYHNYIFNDPAFGDLDDRLTKNHLNPDYVRFELHRVWVVEANLAKGKRHVYTMRRWYIDEDSWNTALTESYDSRDNLWRVGLFLSDYHYDVSCYMMQTQAMHDLPSGHYASSIITLNRKESDLTIPFLSQENFTPAYLRKAARR